MSTVFLFGAGASYGSRATWPYPPPLGKDLFDELLRHVPCAKEIPERYASLLRQDFETGMSRFYATRQQGVIDFLRGMGEYFLRFEPLESNHYRELVRIVKQTRARVVYSTLNYDLLIERSLGEEGIQTRYGGVDDRSGQALVLKLHGSCNFIPDKVNLPNVTWENIEVRNWVGDEIASRPMRGATPREAEHFYRSHDNSAPAMAMYMPGKRSVFSHDFIVAQQQRWREELRGASRIIVCGCRIVAQDDHIWAPLRALKTPLFYVGREPIDFQAWASEGARKQATVLATTFGDALPQITRILRPHRR